MIFEAVKIIMLYTPITSVGMRVHLIPTHHFSQYCHNRNECWNRDKKEFDVHDVVFRIVVSYKMSLFEQIIV